jgi:hypothetical protein
MDISPRRRHAIATVLAVFLAIESVSAVAAAADTSVAGHAPEPAAGTSIAAHALPVAAHALPAATPEGLVYAASGTHQAPVPTHPATVTPTATPALTPTPRPTPKAAPRPTARPAAVAPATRVAAKSAPKPAAAITYAGRNHVWIPSLGINQSVQSFPCSRTRPPDSYVYLWGCAGTNNAYLLGHAASAFRPLHDAYVAGRLKVGMRLWYANGAGVVHQFSVQWWRLTPPTTNASWAWAPQAVPSMTLQTCMGANNQYRLMVRLVQVRG